jgi:hypothetical protein
MVLAGSRLARRIAVGLTMLVVFACGPSMTFAGANNLDFPPTDYVIRSADGVHVIGRAHFSVTDAGPGESIIRGEYRYSNGESDIEDDTVRFVPGRILPQLVRSHHAYFHADGSNDREGRADIAAGTASCTVYTDGQPHVTAAHFDFPPDTFAGAALVIPLRESLKAGNTGKIEFHDFNCVPGPKVLAVSAQPQPSAPWPYYPGELVETEVKLDFGWLNVVVAPFLPEIRAWFDPANDWYFVGGSTSRYYKGTKFLLVRAHSDEAVIKAAPGAPVPPRPASAAMPTPRPRS